MSKNSLTKIFLEKDKREALCELFKFVKTQYKGYKELTKDEPMSDGLICSANQMKVIQLRRFSEWMYNSLQNELYETARICWESIWMFQDFFKTFDEEGYLKTYVPVELSDWSKFLKSWYKKEWAIGVLKLIKDFNFDTQNPDYVVAFQNDFKKVKNESEYCSALLKWNDLIYWSPWKLSLYDNTFQQPLNSHWDSDFNPDYDSIDEEV